MIHVFTIDPVAGHVEKVSADGLKAARSGEGWLWLDVVGAEDSEIRLICSEFGFDRLAVEDVLTGAGLSKIDDYGDHTFVVLHGVADDPDEFRTIEYGSFIGSDYLVVIRSEDLPGFEWAREELAVPGHRPPEAPDRLFARLGETGGWRFNVLADALEESIERLEQRALDGDSVIIGEIQGLRRDTVRLKRVLTPQRSIVRRLGVDEVPGVGDRARMRFRSALDQYDSATESIEASRSLLTATLETYRASVAERANEVMKVLTVFAAIMLPLTFIAGVYGMNFAHMPELDWRWAYPAALGLMATVALSLWGYFAKRGFIRGPRIRRLPNAVGKGLAAVVRTTVGPLGKVGRISTAGRDTDAE